MGFIVVYDACVLYPAPLRDLLVRVGMTGLVQVKWTDDIPEECFRSILEKKPELTAYRLERTRTLMNLAIRDALVEGYQVLADTLELPDPDDRHVLAAAIRCGAQAIVTTNLKHFPSGALAPFNVEALHPDEFILDLLDLAPGVSSVTTRGLRGIPRFRRSVVAESDNLPNPYRAGTRRCIVRMDLPLHQSTAKRMQRFLWVNGGVDVESTDSDEHVGQEGIVMRIL